MLLLARKGSVTRGEERKSAHMGENSGDKALIFAENIVHSADQTVQRRQNVTVYRKKTSYLGR